VGIALILLWTLIPIYWAINSSFRPRPRGSRPAHYFRCLYLTLNNYGQLLRGGDAFSHEILQTMLNSVIESGFRTHRNSPGSNALGLRLRAAVLSWGGLCLFYTVLATMAIPVYALIIPVYRLFC